MRCKNCGWENPAGKSKCEKCNAPLSGSMIDHESHSNYGREGIREEHDSLRSTVRESNVFNSVNGSQGGNKVCENCGYELAKGMKVCPACGTSTDGAKNEHHQSQKSKSNYCPKCGAELIPNARFCPQCGQTLRMGTVGAWDNPQHDEFCTLRPIAWTKEEVQYNPITYSGQVIVLNRENTDPNNQTITSKEQAILTHENGAWYIEDHSERKSTMIRVSKKTKLESGDIIALGNRLFEFKG
ncbi:zinc-ribbon domain-containing protein [uncultured Bacteroides sp.]|uniref:zinc-ribbon domain-containing protein n=1 Tax=uncultured Bacteroides sp. TaxID=162156 RepID=UPI0026100709|nr:zinc-ribbon domain-containing protein [uncultured Bacteroides sp.]